MEFDLRLVEVLKMLTVILEGIFFGGSLYVTLVEAGSRANLPSISHWEQWCNSFLRAAKVMKSTLFLTAITSLGVYYLQTDSRARWLWLVPPGIAVVTVLYTILFLASLNNTLLKKETAKEKGDKWVKDATARWERIHRPRILFSLVGMVFTLYAIIKGH